MKQFGVLITVVVFLVFSSCQDSCKNACGEGVCQGGSCVCLPCYYGTNCEVEIVPDSIYIRSITIKSWPTHDDGDSWDDGDSITSLPDVALYFVTGEDTIYKNNKSHNILPNITDTTAGPLAGVDYEVGVYLHAVTDLVNITMYDYDEDSLGNVTEEFMTWISFTPYIEGNGFEQSREVSSGKGSVVIELGFKCN